MDASVSTSRLDEWHEENPQRNLQSIKIVAKYGGKF